MLEKFTRRAEKQIQDSREKEAANLKREQQKLSTEEQKEWEWNKSERSLRDCGTTDQHTCNGRGNKILWKKYLRK